MRINQDGDDAKLPALMISADDAMVIKEQLTRLKVARVSVSDSPTPANPPPKEAIEPEPEPEVHVVDVDLNRVKTPTVRRIEGSERHHALDSRVLFACDTRNVTFHYILNANPNDDLISDGKKLFTASKESGASHHLLVSGLGNLKGGVNELTFFARKKGMHDSTVVRSEFDVWKSSIPSVTMKPRNKSGLLFHQNPNEVRMNSHPAIDSAFAYGCDFIEEQEGDFGNKGFYDLIASNIAVEINGFTEEQQAIYVVYRLGIPERTPENIINVLELMDEFRKLLSYDDCTGTVEVKEAIALVNGAAQTHIKVRASFKKSSRGEHDRCSFVEAMFDHIALDRANALGLRKFDSLEGELFLFATTAIELADEIDMYLQLHEAERVTIAQDNDGEPATTLVYDTIVQAQEAQPARRLRHLPTMPADVQKIVFDKFLKKRDRIRTHSPPEVDISVGIFYTVDMDLQPGDEPTVPQIPDDAITLCLSSRSDWGEYWQNAWTSDTMPTLANMKEFNKRQFYYSSNATEEHMIPLLSRVEPEKYTFTTISLVDGLAPSAPSTTTLTIAGSVMKTEKNITAKDDADEEATGFGLNAATEADDDGDDDEDDGNDNADDDDDEEAMGFGFVLNEHDDDEVVSGFGDLGVDSSRAAKETGKRLQSVWEEEEKKMVKEKIPQSQQYLRKQKFKKAATARATAEAGAAPVDNAVKSLEETTVVTKARDGQAEVRVIAARTKKDVTSVKFSRRNLEQWKPVNAADLEQHSRENAETHRVQLVEERRVAAEKLRVETEEAERKQVAEEEEKRRKKEERELEMREKRKREVEAFERGEVFIDLGY